MIYGLVWKLNEITWTTVSSLGTFIAIIVSLRLALRDRKEKLEVIPDFMVGGHSEKFGNLTEIKIRNLGHCDVHIDELYVSTSIYYRKIFLALYSKLKDDRTLQFKSKRVLNFFSDYSIRYLPYEFTKEKHFKDATTLPCTLQKFHSLVIIIPESYFIKMIPFSNEVLITVVTSTGRKFSKKKKVNLPRLNFNRKGEVIEEKFK
ncbi:hypothetical protein [Bacillus sp. WP8]|uniref:hypothetical protein n=1 Tax=Bacillus sp. WP8 TaxID=756828 RepID=UPI0011A0C674|nr:hypothetical protein [Bacillus sp. WP8]